MATVVYVYTTIVANGKEIGVSGKRRRSRIATITAGKQNIYNYSGEVKTWRRLYIQYYVERERRGGSSNFASVECRRRFEGGGR